MTEATKMKGHSAFDWTLRVIGLLIVAAGGLHVVLGAGADASLGAAVPAAVLAEPTMDSQNRFYGVSFTVSGLLMWLVASDLKRYIRVLDCVLGVMLAAGVARLVSLAVVGLPSPAVMGLLASEFIAPALLFVWARRQLRVEMPTSNTTVGSAGTDPS